MKIRTIISTVPVTLLALLAWNTAVAIGPFSKAPKSELKLLPKYCVPRHENWGDQKNHPQVKPWLRVFAFSDFRHMHHYCSALYEINIANREYGPGSKEIFNLKRALADFEYMQRNASPQWVLNPELHVKMGEVLLRLDRPGEAVANFQKSIKYKRDYAPAYIKLSSYYKKQGDRAKAEEYLREGLKHNPKSKGLKRRLKEFE